MPYKIAICDDDRIQVELIKSYVLSIDACNEVECIMANSGEELLETIRNKKIDVIFLDIEMNGLNGIETASKIREKDDNVIIVFLTGFNNYALEAFEINAFHYLIKPIMLEEFIALMNRKLNRIREISVFKEKAKAFTLKVKGEIIQFEYDSIYYFEKNCRKIRIHTKDGNYDFYGSIKSLLKDIDADYFLRCHQGYVVNINKVKSYKNGELSLKTCSDVISVSRKYKKEVVRALGSILL